MKEYLALRGEVERDQAGTPFFCACKPRGGKRLSRRHIRVQIDGHLLEAGSKRPGISANPAEWMPWNYRERLAYAPPAA